MIQVTRLNGSTLVLNGDKLETVEANPDTVITLVNGHQFTVLETPAQVIEKMHDWYSRMHARDLSTESAAATSSAVAARKEPPYAG
jgi:flagellar protein FlbD